MIVAQARSPAFYLAYGVPDTVAGRLDMIMLHLVLLLRQLTRAHADHAAALRSANGCSTGSARTSTTTSAKWASATSPCPRRCDGWRRRSTDAPRPTATRRRRRRGRAQRRSAATFSASLCRRWAPGAWLPICGRRAGGSTGETAARWPARNLSFPIRRVLAEPGATMKQRSRAKAISALECSGCGRGYPGDRPACRSRRGLTPRGGHRQGWRASRRCPGSRPGSDLTRHGPDGLRLVGRVSATVVQNCVVTLEPIESRIDEAINLVFLRMAARRPSRRRCRRSTPRTRRRRCAMAWSISAPSPPSFCSWESIPIRASPAPCSTPRRPATRRAIRSRRWRR